MSGGEKRPSVDGFVVGERLGQGSYATVYRAVSGSPGPSGVRDTVAIKCINFQRTQMSRTSQDNLIAEIKILKKMRHRNIVHLIDFRWDANYVYLITEYCAGGDLSCLIRSQRCLSERVVRRFLRQLALAMRYLRSHGLAHMDLKPQNLLLTSKYNPVLKLADFGFAQHLREDLRSGSAFKGSPLYMAPEILHRRSYDARVDLWSIGIILYECLFGTAPFSASSVEELVKMIKAITTVNVPTTHFLPPGVEYEITDQFAVENLMHCLLRPNPKDRITFDDFFTHPWVDLTHAPVQDSWARAKSLGAEGDAETEPTNKVRLYIQAVEFGMGALESAETASEAEAMRSGVRALLRKAECVRDTLRSSIEPRRPPRRPKRDVRVSGSVRASSPAPASQADSDGLLSMWSDVPEVKAAVTVVEAAKQLVWEDRLPEAQAKYELAIQTAIEILKRETADSVRRAELKSAVEIWLKFAEDVKKYLEISGLGLSAVAAEEEMAAEAEEESRRIFASNANCRLM